MNKNGVQFYKIGTLVHSVPFANGEINCFNCPFAYAERGLERIRCRITGEILLFSRTETGSDCPIVFEEEAHEP